MFLQVFFQASVFTRQSCCSQSCPTNSTRDCYVTHWARLRVCYVTEYYHMSRPLFIYFILFIIIIIIIILFYFRCTDLQFADSIAGAYRRGAGLPV